MLMDNVADPVTWLGHGLSEFLAQSFSPPVIPGRSSQSPSDAHGEFLFDDTLNPSQL
jgi:hypothetical protein